MAKINEQFRIIVEYTWLIIAVVSIATSSHSAFRNGMIHKDTISFFFISIIAFLMFFIRRKFRKDKK